MDKLKNFIYDKNDIVIALIIVALAVVIITGRIEAIMTYPDKMLAEISKNAEETPPGSTVPNGSETEDPDGTGTEADPGDTGTATGPIYPAPESGSVYPATPPDNETPPVTPDETTLVKITIPSGTTGDGIGQILATNGLIRNKTDFTSAVVAAGAETKLKAGTFRIPSGSTPAEIVALITK